MFASVGGAFTSLTMTVKVLVSLPEGEPLSVTRTVIELVLGPWASVGVQLKRPLLELIEAPLGTPASRLKMSVCAGTSLSEALAENETNAFSTTVRLVTAISTGGLFDSSTIAVNACVTLIEGDPLSVTLIAITLVVPACVSDGVQAKTPLLELRVAPIGAVAAKLYVRVCAGTSESVAAFVNVSKVPSRTL